MSVLNAGDEKFHYSTGAHRWPAPEHVSQESWNTAVRAHLEVHQQRLGNSRSADEPAACQRRRRNER